MATLPPLFLDSILPAAEDHGVQAHPFPDNKGLLLFPAGLAVAEQCTLLAKKAAELQAAEMPPEPPGQQPANSPALNESVIDCQVSVEERAQLFKFLTG